MDIISHGLWGGITLGQKKRKCFVWAFVFSVLPDIFAEGIMFSLIFLGLDNMPSLDLGHPDIVDFPLYAQNFYNATHSLIVFSVVFGIIWLIRKKPFLSLAAWGIHILIDIPTHSLKLFPTPFFWPISYYKFNGVGWDSPLVLIPNIALLTSFYGIWFWRERSKKSMK